MESWVIATLLLTWWIWVPFILYIIYVLILLLKLIFDLIGLCVESIKEKLCG